MSTARTLDNVALHVAGAKRSASPLRSASRLAASARQSATARTWSIIDGPPRGGGGAAEAGRLADLVLIPCRPSALDLYALPATLKVTAGTRAAVVLNCCPPFGSWIAEASEAIDVLGAERCPVTLGQRIAHARSVTSGRPAQELEPRSAAAAELSRLYRWCMETST